MRRGGADPVSRWDLAELTKMGDSERAVDVHIVRLETQNRSGR